VLPVPCNITRYRLLIERFNYMASSMYRQSFNASEESGRAQRLLNVYYSTVDVTTYVNTKIMTFNAFISTVGGNLGLFVGFSCTSVFFAIIDWAAKLVSLRLQK
jgi:hypothetical protein